MIDGIFKAYDIRGIYGTELDEKIVSAIGQAYVSLISPKKVVVGRDVRTSSLSLRNALVEGLLNTGVEVIDIGLISTEELYFAVAHFGYDGGIMVTASHNPREYNGLKMVKKNAEPLAGEEITQTLRLKAKELFEKPVVEEVRGVVVQKDVVNDFRNFILGFIDVASILPLKIVANPNFGFQGKLVQKVCEALPIEWVFLNGEPDGTFPKGRPDPFIAENRTELCELVKKEKPDFGVAWDADADRVFFATGEGEFLEAYYTNALLVETLLKKHPGSTIVYEPRYTWAILDEIKKGGGEAVRSKVGHAFIKKTMRESNGLMCGESSGHTYFRDFFFADSGILPFLLLIEMISKTGKSLGELVRPFLEKYSISGEINLKLKDSKGAILVLKKHFEKFKIEEFDNLIVENSGVWRFNIRLSNTEPLLRINIEAQNKGIIEELKKEILDLVNDL